MFDKGQLIIYGNNGVCEVMDITKMSFQGINDNRLYYVLQPYYQKAGKIFTPVDNDKVVMRLLISEEVYKECIKSHECRQYIRMIKALYLRKQERILQGKKITATDERYFKQAEDNLYSELAIPLGIPKEEMELYITHRIEELEK